jgi:hypothetical protein
MPGQMQIHYTYNICLLSLLIYTHIKYRNQSSTDKLTLHIKSAPQHRHINSSERKHLEDFISPRSKRFSR